MEEKRYRYIHFVLEDNGKRRTQVWACLNNKSNAELGIVKWYSAWRQYCYFPERPAIYSDGCLHDVASFVASLNDKYRSVGEI
jgi:hypothetical protein